MNNNGSGYNGKYTAQQFKDAIPGTGGIISAIADNVGCAWNTAKKYIDEYPTVKTAWENERNRIKDRARHNIIRGIEQGDVHLSKWWLQVMDDEFVPKQKLDALISNLDVTALSMEQLERIANGENPLHVLSTASGKG